jgi:signal transduction histidine kinase
MAMNPVIPIRRRRPSPAQSIDLVEALAEAAETHGEGQLLAQHVYEQHGIGCVVLARATRGWTVAGASGLPSGMRLDAGTLVASSVEPGRWLQEKTGERWLRRDLLHGRRTVARVMLRTDGLSPDLQRICTLAAPAMAAAYPRPHASGPLELYLAQIIHDIRQPLATLQLAHGLMTEKKQGEPRLLERCDRAVRDLSELMDDLLAFTGPRTGNKKKGLAPVSLLELAASVVDDLAPNARRRDVALVLEARADPTVLGSRLGLRRALANAVDNALVHAPSGTPVKVTVDVDFHSTVVEVRDQGPGVPPGLRDQVFEPFFTTRPNGNGLGLAVVRLVARSHGGTARFLDCDHGARLRVSIPHQPAANLMPV